MVDVYDGQVWKDFAIVNGRTFLSGPHHLGLIVIDSSPSIMLSIALIGVLYLVILNLPCTIKFKLENIIIVGIIPGHNEPTAKEMNSYLRPV